MAAKMDKHELNEPDKLQLFFLRIRAFAGKHRARIYAGGGIFILIVLLAGGWYLYRIYYQTGAGKIYNQIIEAAAKTGSPAGDAAAIKGYKDLISRYPRSRAAVTAYYRLETSILVAVSTMPQSAPIRIFSGTLLLKAI